MHTSPTLTPLLRDILGAEADGISDEMVSMVTRVVAEARYMNIVLGDADEKAALQFCCYQLN